MFLEVFTVRIRPSSQPFHEHTSWNIFMEFMTNCLAVEPDRTDIGGILPLKGNHYFKNQLLFGNKTNYFLGSIILH